MYLSANIDPKRENGYETERNHEYFRTYAEVIFDLTIVFFVFLLCKALEAVTDV